MTTVSARSGPTRSGWSSLGEDDDVALADDLLDGRLGRHLECGWGGGERGGARGREGGEAGCCWAMGRGAEDRGAEAFVEERQRKSDE